MTLSLCGCIANLEVLQTPYYWDFMETSSHRHDQLLNTFQLLTPLWRGWEWGAENFKLLIMV